MNAVIYDGVGYAVYRQRRFLWLISFGWVRITHRYATLDVLREALHDEISDIQDMPIYHRLRFKAYRPFYEMANRWYVYRRRWYGWRKINPWSPDQEYRNGQAGVLNWLDAHD